MKLSESVIATDSDLKDRWCESSDTSLTDSISKTAGVNLSDLYAVD